MAFNAQHEAQLERIPRVVCFYGIWIIRICPTPTSKFDIRHSIFSSMVFARNLAFPAPLDLQISIIGYFY
jgi:hypothetical protein